MRPRPFRPGEWFNDARSDRTPFANCFTADGTEGLVLLVGLIEVIIWVVGALFLLRTPTSDEEA